MVCRGGFGAVDNGEVVVANDCGTGGVGGNGVTVLVAVEWDEKCL